LKIEDLWISLRSVNFQSTIFNHSLISFMNIEYIAQQIVNGLILGSMYAMVAIGFSMIYGIIRLINFAHGDVVMLGAFLTLGLMQVVGAPFPLVALAVLAAGAAMGILIEKTAFRPMRGAPQVTGFIASLAISIMLQNLGILFLTAQPRNFAFPAKAHPYRRGQLSNGGPHHHDERPQLDGHADVTREKNQNGCGHARHCGKYRCGPADGHQHQSHHYDNLCRRQCPGWHRRIDVGRQVRPN
jgi:hypothetical protein